MQKLGLALVEVEPKHYSFTSNSYFLVTSCLRITSEVPFLNPGHSSQPLPISHITTLTISPHGSMEKLPSKNLIPAARRDE